KEETMRIRCLAPALFPAALTASTVLLVALPVRGQDGGWHPAGSGCCNTPPALAYPLPAWHPLGPAPAPGGCCPPAPAGPLKPVPGQQLPAAAPTKPATPTPPTTPATPGTAPTAPARPGERTAEEQQR